MIIQDGKVLIKIVVISLFVTAIAGYSYYQSQNLLKGPQIALAQPLDGSTVEDPLVEITGTAENVSYISLNDRQIYVDNTGAFKEALLASPGYNIWTIQAKDRFGRTVSKKIELVFKKN